MSQSLSELRSQLSVPKELADLASSFRYWVHHTLDDKRRGISALSHVRYKEVKRKSDAQILAQLVPQSEIRKKCGFGQLSCSLVSSTPSKPDEILISLENWLGGSNYGGELSEYRKYLVNHEFLHCRPFHLDHPKAKAMSMYCAGGTRNRHPLKLPVMYQQSKGGLRGCRYNSWPLTSEL